jgi:hypothetical protein
MLKRIAILVGAFVLLVVCLALAIQLIPVQETNPPVVAEPPWDSPETRALAQRACFDCHSNETVWPSYARIAPLSWVIANDTNEGRDRLNFSEWGVGRAGSPRAAEEVGEVIQRGSMPPALYVMTHPSASLTQAEKDQLIQGLEASLH